MLLLVGGLVEAGEVPLPPVKNRSFDTELSTGPFQQGDDTSAQSQPPPTNKRQDPTKAELRVVMIS